MIKCLIVDDEPLAIDLIAKHLKDYGGFEIVAKCYNVKDVVVLLKQNKVDLIFLDIQMPEIDGVSFLKSLSNAPAVIFTTAYRKYALDAFDVGAVDYLLKPVSFLRFSKAIEKFYAYRTQQLPVETESPITLKHGVEYSRILPSDILYIAGDRDYVKVFTSVKTYMVRGTLKNILDLLPTGDFIQIHKSYIIPVKSVESVSSKYVKVHNNKVPIGPSYLALVKDKFSR